MPGMKWTPNNLCWRAFGRKVSTFPMVANTGAASPVQRNWSKVRSIKKAQVALNNRQINNGYVILCVARPLSDISLEIGVESHDNLYRNPFLDPLQPHELKPDIADPLPASGRK